MNEEQIQHWLHVLGAQRITVGHGWISCSCPLAPYRHAKGKDKRPSFGIQVGPGDSRTYCLACGYAGSQSALLQELVLNGHDLPFQDLVRLIIEAETPIGELPVPAPYEVLAAIPEILEYPESMRLALEPAYCANQVHPYLASRGIDYTLAEKLDIRFDTYRQRVVFPVRDYQGVLRGLHGRKVGTGDLPYLAYPYQKTTNLRFTWFGEHLIDRTTQDTVLLVESVFDLTSTWYVYERLLCPMRATITAEQLERITWIPRAVTFFDADEAGDRARKKTEKFFSEHKIPCRHALPPEGKDPGNLSPEKIYEILLSFLPSQA